MDKYRTEYNKMLLDKATGANSIVQDKYVTISVCKKNIEDACKQRVYHHAQSSVYRQDRACQAPEYFRPSDELYHECRRRTGAFESGQLSCTVCQ